MQALILAAGRGNRLGYLTKDKPKCMIKLNNETIIERLLKQLESNNILDICIVTGYQEDILKEFIISLDYSQCNIEFISNNNFDTTNNSLSVLLAEKFLTKSDTLLIESDLIFGNDFFSKFNGSHSCEVACAKFEDYMNGTCLHINRYTNEIKFNYIDKAEYKTINVYRMTKEFSKNYFIPELKKVNKNDYYELAFKNLSPNLFYPIVYSGRWYEIDNQADLDAASTLFGTTYNDIANRYGGYWRNKEIQDFCYLYNPYFPNLDFKNELINNFNNLLCQYPSTLKIINRLSSGIFNIDARYICTGNGSAEFIKIVMLLLKGKCGFISPSFNEYLECFNGEKVVMHTLENKGFQYTVLDVIDFYSCDTIDNLVLVNPDNPTGNFLVKEDLLKLLNWCLENNIKLIYDESFGDFAKDFYTLVSDNILEAYPNLIVIKSISKSYGVPGLRIGILATAATDILATINVLLPIWDINSFAEYFLLCLPRYLELYKDSLFKCYIDKLLFIQGLNTLGILCYPGEGNFILAKILPKLNLEELFCSYNIFIKSLNSKIISDNLWVRISVKDSLSNLFLLDTLKKVLN